MDLLVLLSLLYLLSLSTTSFPGTVFSFCSLCSVCSHFPQLRSQEPSFLFALFAICSHFPQLCSQGPSFLFALFALFPPTFHNFVPRGLLFFLLCLLYLPPLSTTSFPGKTLEMTLQDIVSINKFHQLIRDDVC